MTVHLRARDYPQSFLSGVTPDEAELTAGQLFTDATLCIGCKACEVACKEWNALPADHLGAARDQLRLYRRPLGDDLAPTFILSSTSPRMASGRP